jgi:hypothetical protein
MFLTECLLLYPSLQPSVCINRPTTLFATDICRVDVTVNSAVNRMARRQKDNL